MQQVELQETELVKAFRTLSESRREMALAFMQRYAGVVGSSETRMIVGQPGVSDGRQKSQPHP